MLWKTTGQIFFKYPTEGGISEASRGGKTCRILKGWEVNTVDEWSTHVRAQRCDKARITS